jgi:hypothetical protein
MKGDCEMKTILSNIDELKAAVQTAELIINSSRGVSPYQVKKWLKALRTAALLSFDNLIKETK